MTKALCSLCSLWLILCAFVAAQRPVAREDAYRQNNVGVAHLERYDFAAATGAFRKALEIDRNLSIARLNLAIALFEKRASHSVYHKETVAKEKFDRAGKK